VHHGFEQIRLEGVEPHAEDLLELNPHDAEERGIRDGDEVTVASRVGATTMRAAVSDRMVAVLVGALASSVFAGWEGGERSSRDRSRSASVT
jgi:predicted molibdopterin-dependent oxidoreductase YjgC